MTSSSPEGVASPRQGESELCDSRYPVDVQLSPGSVRMCCRKSGHEGFHVHDRFGAAVTWPTPGAPAQERRVLRSGYAIENAKGDVFATDYFYTKDQAERMARSCDEGEAPEYCPHRPLYVELVVAVPPGEE